MTWKSVATDFSRLERPRRPPVVEGHERVVEDERRPPVAGHQPDEAEAGDQEDEVERALAERTDRHPVALLGRMDLDVERLVVDPDPAIAATGDRRQVAHHVRLEVARRGLHRRLLGAIDALERDIEDALAALRGGQLLAPGGQALGVTGDLLGVDARWPRPGRGRWPRRRAPARGRSPGRGPRPRAVRAPAVPWRSGRAPRARSSSARSRARRCRAGTPASRAVPCRRAPRAGRA